MKFNWKEFFSILWWFTVCLLGGVGAGTVIGKLSVWVMGIATTGQLIDLAFTGIMFAVVLVMSIIVGFIAGRRELTPTE